MTFCPYYVWGLLWLSSADVFPLSPVVRGNRPGKPVQLAEYEIKYLCAKAREIFINQPILLELEAPIKICGMFCISKKSPKPNLLCVLTPAPPFLPVKVTFTANITTFFDSSSTAGFLQKPITCFSATTWTEESNRWKLSASSLHTRSNIPKTSSSCEAIMKAPVSIGYTAFTTNVRLH